MMPVGAQFELYTQWLDLSFHGFVTFLGFRALPCPERLEPSKDPDLSGRSTDDFSSLCTCVLVLTVSVIWHSEAGGRNDDGSQWILSF